MCALISALKKTPVEDSTVILGEVGLLGEVRKINKLDTRLKEASKLGFKRAIVPRTNKASQSGLQVNEISHIKELGNFFLLST
jgi:DNA repair protein RadA/Sms